MTAILTKTANMMKFVVNTLIQSGSVCVSILSYICYESIKNDEDITIEKEMLIFIISGSTNFNDLLFNIDVCLFDRCGPNAECFGENHLAVCRCPSGYEGNPIDPHVGCIRKLFLKNVL